MGSGGGGEGEGDGSSSRRGQGATKNLSWLQVSFLLRLSRNLLLCKRSRQQRCEFGAPTPTGPHKPVGRPAHRLQVPCFVSVCSCAAPAGQLAFDATLPAVRVAVLEGLQLLVDNQHAQPVLKVRRWGGEGQAQASAAVAPAAKAGRLPGLMRCCLWPSGPCRLIIASVLPFHGVSLL